MKLSYATEKVDEVTGARLLSPESSSAILNSIASQCNNRVVVFDLDSTLLDNRARNAKIMQEFGALQNQTLLMQAKPEHWQDWSANNAMSAMGMAAQDINRLVDDYTAFWDERFFTSHYCQYDVQVAGAVAYVTQLHQTGAAIRYLTGRHEAMRDGTQSSLSTLGFPVPGADGTALIMKTEQSIPDDDYKKNVMPKLSLEHEVLAAFDNEPYHINAYRKAYPSASCIHLHTDHSMRPIRLLDGIVSIQNFIR